MSIEKTDRGVEDDEYKTCDTGAQEKGNVIRLRLRTFSSKTFLRVTKKKNWVQSAKMT